MNIKQLEQFKKYLSIKVKQFNPNVNKDICVLSKEEMEITIRFIEDEIESKQL